MMEKNLYPEIPQEKFAFIHKDERIHDEKLQTKSISYLGDAWLRFRKNKSSVVAFCLIVFLLLFAIITPFVSPYTVQFRDGYYKSVLPKNTLFENAGFWDGARKEKVSEIGYHYYNAIGQETGVPVVKKEYDHYTDANGVTYYNLRVDSYALVGFAYVNLSETEYNNLMAYQNEKDIQVIYPLQKTHNSQYMMGNGGANFWYQLKDESVNTNGDPALDENGSLIPNYLTSDNPNKANYNSKRIAGDDGADGQWYTYAQKNQTGYRVRVHYLEYFRYVNGYEPTFIFGTNNYGQDIFTCLAVGARLSFLLSIVVASINFILGVLYGSIEGYYGGAVDMVMERISDVLNSVPFMVVATLFQLHLAEKVGVLPSLLFAFVLTGWVGTAARVRTQFYRFKGQEYVLAARTLGASDARLIFKHIFPNSLGTIVTGAVMTIGRRAELLRWAEREPDRYLIEDDYDSEFRYRGKPIPSLQSSDEKGKVIYIGTFSKAIAPAIRVSYMVLPGDLLDIYRRDCSFYSCTVSRIDQRILNEFIRDGYFERHLNKMRMRYRAKHDLLLAGLEPFKKQFVISGEDAGLHLLLTAKGNVTEQELLERAAAEKVKAYGMSENMVEATMRKATVLLGFGSIDEAEMQEGLRRLQKAWL